MKKILQAILKKWLEPEDPTKEGDYTVRVYPSQRSCIKSDMTYVKPEQMPPLMVRKARWRQ